MKITFDERCYRKSIYNQ